MPQLHTLLHFHLTPIVNEKRLVSPWPLLNSQNFFCSVPVGAENPPSGEALGFCSVPVGAENPPSAEALGKSE